MTDTLFHYDKDQLAKISIADLIRLSDFAKRTKLDVLISGDGEGGVFVDLKPKLKKE